MTKPWRVLVGVMAVGIIAVTSVSAVSDRTLHIRWVAPRQFTFKGPALKWRTSAASAEIAIKGGPAIFQKNARRQHPMASTTKMMTAYLTLVHHVPLDRMVRISKQEVLNDQQGLLKNDSEVPLRLGQQVSVRDLLYALMLPSADDVAWVLARTVDRRAALFVRQMNLTARTLGMTQTHYADPDGVSPKSYSTVQDLIKLVRVAMRVPLFRQLVRTKVQDTRAFGRLVNLNLLLGQYPGAIGVKTGWTPSAGSCLTFAARRTVHGHPLTLYGAVLGEPSFGPMFSDTARLLSTGFRIPWRIVVKRRTIVAAVRPQSVWGAPGRLTFSLAQNLGEFVTGGQTRLEYRWIPGLRTWSKGQVVGQCRLVEQGWHAGPWVNITANQRFSGAW